MPLTCKYWSVDTNSVFADVVVLILYIVKRVVLAHFSFYYIIFNGQRYNSRIRFLPPPSHLHSRSYLCRYPIRVTTYTYTPHFSLLQLYLCFNTEWSTKSGMFLPDHCWQSKYNTHKNKKPTGTKGITNAAIAHMAASPALSPLFSPGNRHAFVDSY